MKRNIKLVLTEKLKEKKTSLLKNKKKHKSEEDEKKEKGGRLIRSKADGGFKSMSSGGHKDSVKDTVVSEALSTALKNEIKKLKKKGKEDEDIMLTLGKKSNVKQKDMDEIAKFLLKL